MLSEKPTRVKRSEVLEWFGGKQRFIDVHKSESDYYYDSDMSIEDE